MSVKVVELRTLREGSYIMIDDAPCRIISYQTAKTGKHGSMKARVEGMGIMDSQRRSIVKPVDAEVQVPLIERRAAQVTHLSDRSAGLMDLNSFEMFELEIPGELKGQLTEGAEVEYIVAAGRKKLDRVRGGK